MAPWSNDAFVLFVDFVVCWLLAKLIDSKNESLATLLKAISLL